MGLPSYTLVHSSLTGSSLWKAWLIANVAEGFRRQQLEPSIGALPEIGDLRGPFLRPPLYTYNNRYEGNKYMTAVLEARHNC